MTDTRDTSFTQQVDHDKLMALTWVPSTDQLGQGPQQCSSYDCSGYQGTKYGLVYFPQHHHKKGLWLHPPCLTFHQDRQTERNDIERSDTRSRCYELEQPQTSTRQDGGDDPTSTAARKPGFDGKQYQRGRVDPEDLSQRLQSLLKAPPTRIPERVWTPSPSTPASRSENTQLYLPQPGTSCPTTEAPQAGVSDVASRHSESRFRNWVAKAKRGLRKSDRSGG